MDPAKRSELAGVQWFLLAVTVFQPLLHLAANQQDADRYDPWFGRALLTLVSGAAWLATLRWERAQQRASDLTYGVALALQAYLLTLAVPNQMAFDYFVGLVMTTAVMVTTCGTLPQLVAFGLITVGGAGAANELSPHSAFETSAVTTVLAALVGAVGVVIYQRSRLERQLAAALSEVRRLDSTKSRVLHDLANVASRLVGSCDELEEQLPHLTDRLPGEVAEIVEDELTELRRAVDYIVDLHTNVRGLHREGGGTTHAQNVQRMLDTAVSIARRELPPSTTVEVSCPPTVTVRCDPTDLSRIVVNLLINAGHAMSEHGVAAPTLRVIALDHDDRVRVRVEDNGPGIPGPLRQKVFEPRFTTRKEVGGTGLGLAISRDLAGQNGGTLTLDPEYTAGAAFVVDLPAGPIVVPKARKSA